MGMKLLSAAIWLTLCGAATAQQVSTLPVASLPLTGAEKAYVVQNGSSKQTTISSILAGAGGGLALGAPITGGTNGYVLYDNAGFLGFEAVSGTGTVTSVAQTVPSFLSVSGSPVTTNGTLAITLATEAANVVFAGPASGGAVAPTFRALVAADLPVINLASSAAGGVSGNLPVTT